MYNAKEYKRVVAIKEMVSGNESVGSMWIETKTFDKNTKIDNIISWASNAKGKLIITIDQDTITKETWEN